MRCRAWLSGWGIHVRQISAPAILRLTGPDRLAGKYNREKIGSGRKKGEEAKPVSANTLNHELAYLRAVFNELERLGEWQGDNPLGKMRALKFDETEMAYLSAAQIPPLLASLDSSSKAAGLIARICFFRLGRVGRRQKVSNRTRYAISASTSLARSPQKIELCQSPTAWPICSKGSCLSL